MALTKTNGDHNGKVSALEQKYVDLKEDVDDLKGDLGRLSDKTSIGFKELSTLIENRMVGSAQNRIGVWTISAGFVGLCCTILWLLIQLQTQNSVSPVKSQMDYLGGQITQLSIDQRSTFSGMADLKSQFVASEADRRAKETEVETQFRAMAQLGNVQFAQQSRTNAVIWNASKDKLGEYPRYPVYFPDISRKGNDAQE